MGTLALALEPRYAATISVWGSCTMCDRPDLFSQAHVQNWRPKFSHHLTSFVPKMNVHYINQPPFYIAYSNCMQRRRWQPLLLPHTGLAWDCLFSMHTIASNTLEQLWLNQKNINMENMLMAFLLSGPGTKSLRRHFWLKSRITFFGSVRDFTFQHFNLVQILRWTLWILHTLLVQFSSCPDQERRTYSILLAVTALRQSRHDATRPISN